MRYVREDPPEIGQKVLVFLLGSQSIEGVYEGTEVKEKGRVYGKFMTEYGVMYSNNWKEVDENAE